MTPLFPIPPNLQPPALEAETLFNNQKYRDTVTLCEKELAVLAPQLPPRHPKSPRDAEPNSALYQTYTLTLLLVNAFAALQEWKPAKEILGKYRVRFPRDPWGFSAGAEVTRRDPAVKDRDAVNRAVELLEGEALRLQAKP